MLNLKKFIQEIVKIKKQVVDAKESEQKIMAFFGWTGSGKSTSINIIMGADIEINKNLQLDVKKDSAKYVEIGHDTKLSCTLYPALVKNGPGEYAFFDTAGVMDDRGIKHLTESAIAACSLPLLLNDSYIHGIFLVISKDFLERTGKSSFSELIDSLRSLVNLGHDKIQRKIFFILTKTSDLGALKVIEDMIAVMPDNLKQTGINKKKGMLATGNKEARNKLDACKDSDNLNHLIDNREKYGNVFILRGDHEDDVEILKSKLTRCKLIRSSDKPEIKMLDNINAGAAYVRWKDKLYYINKYENICDLIDVSKEALGKFDELILLNTSLPEKKGVKNLTLQQIKNISELTGHNHLRAIMKPIPKEAFTLQNPITQETKFTKLRSRAESMELDTTFSQYEAILKFKNTLVNTIDAYNLIINKAIHLPNLDILCGIELQNACLELIASYNKADLRVFPDYLRTLKNQLAEFSQLIPEFCEEAGELCQYFTDMANELENIFNLPPLTAQMVKNDQIENSKNALTRINTISPANLTTLNNIFDKSDANYLYWQQLHSCNSKVSRDPNNAVYNNLVQSNNRDENLQKTLNTLATFTHNAVDDACISVLAHYLLDLRSHYTTALYSPIKTPILPLANNLPLFSHTISKMVEIEENNLQQQLDSFAIHIDITNENLASFTAYYMDFINNPAAIFDRLFTDYYQCLANIKQTQDAYITQYQSTLANGVNLLAGPQAYINTFNGRGPAATLNIPGGGTLDQYVTGNIDATLLAAEALRLLSFSVGTPQKNSNVQRLELDRKDFCNEIFQTTNDTYHNRAGGILGNKFFSNQNAQWESVVPLQVGNNQQVYSVRLYKDYEHFRVKAAFLKYWCDAPYSGDGSGQTFPPGHFLTDFGGYDFNRRRPPHLLNVSHSRGDADDYYSTEPNRNYNSQTATIEQALQRAIQDYIDVQSSSAANRTFTWCFNNQAITLSALNSTVTLINQALITNARADIDNWFMNHRNALINCFNTHTAATGTGGQQNILNERKTHLFNLDITVALIKLFAKLYGKDVNNNLFSNLVTHALITQDINNIRNLLVMDLSPSLNTAINSPHSTHQNILGIADDYQARFLHPRTLINYLTSKVKLHQSLLNVRNDLPLFMQTYPQQDLQILAYLQSLPPDCQSIKIQNRKLTALDTACLAIAMRERKSCIRKLKLRDNGLSDIGSIIQACTQLQELDISFNPLSEKSLTDISALLALNTGLVKLNLSASPNKDPFILTSKSALELLASLYLNRHLEVLTLNNVACDEPIILQAIQFIMIFKKSSDKKINVLNDEKYFLLLDEQLENFLKDNPHPVSDFDKRDKLFNDEETDEYLRTKIDDLRKVIIERSRNFDMQDEIAYSSNTSQNQKEKISHPQKSKSKNVNTNRETTHHATQHKEQFNQAKVERRDGLEIAKNYWYEDGDMNHILQVELNQHNRLTSDGKSVSILGPLDNISPYGLQRALREHNYQTGVIVIPYNLGNLHWVGLILEYDVTGSLIRADYYDSLAGNIRPYLNDILKSVSRANDKVQNFTSITAAQGLIRQNNGDDCGPCTIANLLAGIGFREDSGVDAVGRRLGHLRKLRNTDNIFYQSFYERQRLNQSSISSLNKSTRVESAKKISNSAGSNLMSMKEYQALLELALDILKLNNLEFKNDLAKALTRESDASEVNEHKVQLMRIRSVFSLCTSSKDPLSNIAKRLFSINEDSQFNINDASIKLDWSQFLPLSLLLALSQKEIEEDILAIAKFENYASDTNTKKDPLNDLNGKSNSKYPFDVKKFDGTHKTGASPQRSNTPEDERFSKDKKPAASVSPSNKSGHKNNGVPSSYTSLFKKDNSAMPQKTTQVQQQFTLLNSDNITVESIENHCRKISIDIKKSVLIFPGNPSHHQNNSLFQIKSGAGLASLADSFGQKGFACLSLPTANLESLSTAQLDDLKSKAIADIWRAVGFGMSILLPVRPHLNQTYFTQSIKSDNGLFEPKFWGGIVNQSNRELGDYYVSELIRIKDFITTSDQQKTLQNMLQQPYLKQFYDAYQEGTDAKMTLNDNKKKNPWFK